MAKQVLGDYDLPEEGDIIDQVAHRHDRLSGMKQEVAELKARTDFKGLLTWFGFEVKKNGRGWKILCPFHVDTDPSCSVDLEKGLFHCFGCGVEGDTIEFVKLYKHTDFKGAVKVLKEYNGLAGKHATLKEKEKPFEVIFPEETEQEKKDLLNKTLKEYHNQLIKNEKALAFLETRGLKDFELITQYTIGFCDGKILLSKLSGKQKELLKETGIINAKGREHFTGCIVIPVFTGDENAGEIYGRSITDKEPKHRYLKGRHEGIFNRKAGKIYDEIILAESFIDALSLIRLGINNVQAIYGTSGFTKEHLEALKEDRVKTIILGLDNDTAGRTASLNLQKTLVHEGFAVKTIFPPGVKDWNDFLVSKGDPDQVKKLIAEAPVVQQEEKENTRTFSSVEKHLNTYTFTTGRMTYTVIGVKDLFVASLRVAVRARCENERFCDTVDLYSARSRKNYSAGLADEIITIEPARIQADLNKILDYLEEERNRRFNNRDKEERIELTDGEVKAGMKLLQNQNMVNEVLKDFLTLGYVGENENKLLVFFAALSRLLDDPLNIYIQAGSSSGKSYLLETLIQMLPDECLIDSSSFSDKALYYCDDDYFMGKVFILGESVHDEGIEAQIRLMQSEKKISRMVTLKDESGMMRTRLIKKQVRSSFMSTSTALYLNPENASRCMILHVDESKEQTTKVLKKQRENEMPGSQVETGYLKGLVKRKHHAAQRLLKEVIVVNPYARYIAFPANRPAMRRNQKHFLNLNNAICTARQMQKEEKTIENPYTGEKMKVTACDITDYRIAYKLYTKAVLLANRSDLPASCINLYENIRHMVKKEAGRQGVDPCALKFIQRQVRKLTGLGPDSVKKYIKMLVDYEYLHITSGARQGTRYSYHLREDKPVEELDMSVIPPPEAMEKMIEKSSVSGESGENADNLLF